MEEREATEEECEKSSKSAWCAKSTIFLNFTSKIYLCCWKDEKSIEHVETIQVNADSEPDEEGLNQTEPKKVPNQFNFCERAAMTYNNSIRVSK